MVRSADWVRLEYENQKPLQTLTGHLVQPGNAFTVSPEQMTVAEGQSATFSAQAEGAHKVYWVLRSGEHETVVATDQFDFTFDAGRVSHDQTATLRFKAIYANEVKIRDIPITIKEDLPEPVFTLKAPGNWDGRETIEVMSEIANREAMQAKGVDELKFQWSMAGLATITESDAGRLMLQRSQNSGYADGDSDG